MSNLQKISPITESEIKSKGIISLSVRPNQRSSGSQYGEGNLSAKELQDRFDRLARIAIDRCNMITQLLSGEYKKDQNAVAESIMEYIRAYKGFTFQELLEDLLTTSGKIKAIDPTASNAYQELDTVINNLYDVVSTNSDNVDAIRDDLNNYLPKRISVGFSQESKVHYFQLRNEKGDIIDGSKFSIDLFLHHNKDQEAHSDIRSQLGDFMDKVNSLLNSDDKTLDETKEIVAYIKSNKDLIDAITTSKVNVSDIADNLGTNDPKKVLSAAQGAILKALIDEIANSYVTIDIADNAFVRKNTTNNSRMAYVRDYGIETTKPIVHDYTVNEERKEANGQTPYNTYNIACRNKRGAITVANPIGDYDAVNKKTMISTIREELSNVENVSDLILEELDKRYAKKGDFESYFEELHEYAQAIISEVDG